MSSVRETIVFGLAMLAALAVIAHCTEGCKPAEAPKELPEFCYDEQLFTDQLVECAKQAVSRQASKQCRQKVHEACGIVLTITKGEL